MRLAACNLSIIPLRSEASHRSEMLSQILFAELFEVLEEGQDFVKIKMCDTGYEGWIQNNQFTILESVWPAANLLVDRNGGVAVFNNQTVSLLHGTKLPGQQLNLGKDKYIIQSKLREVTLEDFDTEIQHLITDYINSPYLWGGRSRYGIDCSGFSQLIYAHFGVHIPRDAWQQAEKGTVVDFLAESKKGDLAFFDNEVGAITHVGILLNEQQIIHASGRVRIDKIDNEGIFNVDLQKYTHRLRIVKRYF